MDPEKERSEGNVDTSKEHADEAPTGDAPTGDAAFPVVGIGASAGGLRAFEAFFEALPDDPGMAFVLVQHLDPDHESELAALVQRHTGMPVTQVSDQATPEPDHVYVIPPGKSLRLREGKLHLTEPEQPHGQRAPIDLFFRSLADECGERAVCVILSGTGSDGALGLKSVKERGGLVMAQAPGDAEYDGMPQSALATDLVDLVAPAGELAEQLMAYRRSADRIALEASDDAPREDGDEALQRVLGQLRTQTGHDFSAYKRSTIRRRLRRRMQVNQTAEVEAYLDHMRENEDEADALFKDFLISVTNFFRDSEAFGELEKTVIPQLFEEKGPGDQIRVWVPGCATGEEAYSIAILLHEEARRREAPPEFQVFASDLDADALAFARAGLYPDPIAADLSPERLEQFFTQEDDGYRVREEVRDTVLLAQHNLIKDPPFSKLDLISCRNLLIYLDRSVQGRVIKLFHYALRSEGYLFLGSSETAGDAKKLFRVVEGTHRIYRRQPGERAVPRTPLVAPATSADQDDPAAEADAAQQARSLGGVHRDLMLKRYAPPSVIVDGDYDIRYLFGGAGPYLQRSEGDPTHGVLQNVTEELRTELRPALFQAFRHNEATRSRALSIPLSDGTTRRVHLKVDPVRGEALGEDMALIVFEPAALQGELPEGGDGQSYEADLAEQLEDELRDTKHRLRTVIEQYETSNQELKVSNEELQSTNEELRSTTEELETSKEELQSTNEELHTVNSELEEKNQALQVTNSDLQNLMSATDIATLFLDRELCLKRSTPRATQLFRVTESDAGRPLSHVAHDVAVDDLEGLARQVLDRLEALEREVQSTDGLWFLMRVLPYRTLEGTIDGVVLTFVEITELKRYQQEITQRGQQQVAVAELGQYALRGTPLQDLMDMAVRTVAQTLGLDLCTVLERQPGGETLLLRAGVGWAEGLVGEATVSAGKDSQAGYTLEAEAPIFVEDLAAERRFSGSPLFTDHDVRSGLSVVIQQRGRPYGVLSVHTRTQRTFSEQDAHFMLAVANVLAAAVERINSEEALRESKERLRLAVEGAGLGMWSFDLATNVVTFNERLAQLFGLREEVSYDETMERVHPEDRPAVDQAVGNALDPAHDLDEYSVEHRIVHPDGAWCWVQARGRAYFTEEGTRVPERIVGVAIDVTSQREAENDLRESREALRALNQTLEERVATQTRRVRELASSLTLAEQRERHRIAQVLHDDLQQILYGAQVQLKMADDALSGSGDPPSMLPRTEELIGRAIQVARTLTVDLSPPVLRSEGLAEALQWLAEQMHVTHDLRVDVAVETERSVVVSSEEMRVLLFQLTRELLFNVVKHAETDQAHVRISADEEQIGIRVEDEGKGFDAEDLDAASHLDSGFGLYSVRERLNLFGGELRVESRPGAGTRAAIVAPLDYKNLYRENGASE